MDFTEKLPLEICQNIFSYLPGEDLWNLFEVSRNWKDIVNDDILWRGLCLIEEIDISGPVPEGEFDPELCVHARFWGAWRWRTVYNWEKDVYLQAVVPSLIFTDSWLSSCGDKIALTNGSQVYVYTRRNSEILTLFDQRFGSFKVRDISINKDFLIILLQTCVLVYRTKDYQPYLMLGFNGGRLIIRKTNCYRADCKSCISHGSVFEFTSVEFVYLNGNSLWMSPYLFLKSAVIVELDTATSRDIHFPWKCTLLRINENVIARSDTQLAVYSMNGEKAFEITCLHYSWIKTSKNVLALISEDGLDSYDRRKGDKLGVIKKSFFEVDVNYKQNLLYGLSKTPIKFKVKVEALVLVTGRLLWSVELSFDEYYTEVRLFLNKFVCCNFTNSQCWYILDSKTGKFLHQRALPEKGRIVFISDLFCVCKTPDNLVVRFY